MKSIPFLNNPLAAEREKLESSEELFTTADSVRRKFEGDWYTNILYLAGSQWEKAADDIRRWRRVPLRTPNAKVRMTSHHILPLARQAASILRASISQSVAVAATPDQSDREAAEFATNFLRARYHEDREEERRFYEILWCMVAGRVLRMTYWDPHAESRLIPGPIRGAGEIATVTLNPFRFYLAPWNDCTTEPSWIILSDIRDVDEIRELYGVPVDPENSAYAFQMLDDLLVNIVGETASEHAPNRRNTAVLKRLYAKPNRDYPAGRLFAWANGKLLQETDLPEGEMPFVALDWFPIPGRLYPLPFLTPLRDLQQEVNITLSQLIELKNRQLRGDILVRGSGDVTQEIDPQTGRKTIRLGPDVLDWRLLEYGLDTAEAERILARLWNDAMEIAGVHESSLGRLPSHQVTATQVVTLKEADSQGLALFKAGFDLAYAVIDRQKLMLARNHYHVPRMVRVVGENHIARVFSFFGSDLRNTEDVRPKPVPVMSEAAKTQMKMEVADKGLYDLSGTPHQKLAKVTALLNSGIPGIEADVEALLAPLTIEELRRTCAEITRLELESALSSALAEAEARKEVLTRISSPEVVS